MNENNKARVAKYDDLTDAELLTEEHRLAVIDGRFRPAVEYGDLVMAVAARQLKPYPLTPAERKIAAGR